MYFTEPVLFEIPVRPRIQKFIAAKLRAADGNAQPLFVSSESEGASLMLWALAQSRKVRIVMGWRRSPGEQGLGKGLLTDGSGRVLAPDDMTARLGVGLCEFHPSRHQYLLNYAELETFSEWVDYLIQNEVVMLIEARVDQAYMATIKQFVDHYDFSEQELSERSLQQMYLRYRKETGAFRFKSSLTHQRHFQTYALAA